MIATIVDYLLNTMFVILSIACAFVAYVFWISKNGELRRILITKNISLSFMFGVYSVMVYHTVRWITFACSIPVFVSIIWLIVYMLKNNKNATN